MHPKYAPLNTPNGFIFFSHLGPECDLAQAYDKVRELLPNVTDADIWVAPYNGATPCPAALAWTAFVRSTRAGDVQVFMDYLDALQAATADAIVKGW